MTGIITQPSSDMCWEQFRSENQTGIRRGCPTAVRAAAHYELARRERMWEEQGTKNPYQSAPIRT